MGGGRSALKLFISYSHHDLDAARAIHQALMGADIPCWRDEKWILAGNDFAEEITAAIHSADAVLLLLSSHSAVSDYVAIETALAFHFRIRIIPVLLAPVQIPFRLLPYLVRLHQVGPFPSERLGPSIVQVVLDLGKSPSGRSTSGPDPIPVSAVQAPADSIKNHQYERFIRETQHEPPPHWNRRSPFFRPAEAGLPVTNVSWDDAVAYCDWAGLTLPSGGFGLLHALAAAAGDASAIESEWMDGGMGQFKRISGGAGTRKAALLHRTVRRSGLGFRAVPVSQAVGEVLFLEEAVIRRGPDLKVLGEISSRYRMPNAAVQTVMGRANSQSKVRGFRMARTCVTNQEYWEFQQRTGHRPPRGWQKFQPWILRMHGTPFPPRMAAWPVTEVSLADAARYCAHVGGRLPTSWEWERAARGPEDRRYPWGREYDPINANSLECGWGGLTAADDLAGGDTPEGVRQMCGNVFEWVMGDAGRPELRGGSWQVPCELWGLSWMFSEPQYDAGEDIGFRVVFS